MMEESSLRVSRILIRFFWMHLALDWVLFPEISLLRPKGLLEVSIKPPIYKKSS
jgi:hypothetical protein